MRGTPHGGVEGEEPGLEGRELSARLGACPAGGDGHDAVVSDGYQFSVPELEGRIDRFPEPRRLTRVGLQAVHHHLDGVSLVALEGADLLDPLDLAVDSNPDVPLLLKALQQGTMLALSVSDLGGRDLHSLAGIVPEELLDDGLRGP